MEIALVLLVVAIASTGLYAYLSATKTSLDAIGPEPQLTHARLAADLSTLAAIRNQIDLYRSVHGQWPTSRDAVLALLRPAPRFQCAGNDYTYDPASGAVGLVIMDPHRC